MSVRASALITLALATTPCVGLGQSTTRDSAGITIVENKPSAPGSITVQGAATLNILSAVREPARTSVVRLANGAIVLVDPLGSWFRFDSLGQGAKVATTLPTAPIQFIARWSTDSIVAFYRSAGWLYYADASLKVLKASLTDSRPRFGADLPSPVLRDGSLILQFLQGPFSHSRVVATRDSVMLATMSPDGVTGPTFMVLPSTQAFAFALVDEPGRITMAPDVAAAFARTALVRGLGDSLVIGDGDSFEFRISTLQGETRRIIRSMRLQRVPTAADTLQVLGPLARSTDRLSSARLANGLPTIPAFSRIEVTPGGQFWVQDWRITNSMQEWTLFDSGGAEKGRLSIADKWDVVDFGLLDVLVSERDAVGEAWIRKYPLSIPR